MEQKIAEIIRMSQPYEDCGNHCGDKLCKDSYSCIDCATRRILALIEQREKQMREALKEARKELEYWKAGLNPASSTDEAIAKIDAVLEGK